MNWRITIFTTLTLGFVAFTASIYTRRHGPALDHSADAGLQVWQKYNCQSCHQIYGLGGYLGPDLTNVMSQDGKGSAFVLAMVRSGVKQMPAFRLSREESNQLLDYLRKVDSTGQSDPRRMHVSITGMTEAAP